jgi:acyl carrier protein
MKKVRGNISMDELMEILKGARPDVDFENEEALIDDGILVSFDIIYIVNAINEAFDIEVNVSQLKPENFNSAEAMWEMIQEMQD